MWSRGGARTSVLDRAKAQLSGQRISNIKDRKDVENFGTVGPQARRTRFSDLSDVSVTPSKKLDDQYDPEKKALEDFSVGGGSRFLKKISRDPAGERIPTGKDAPEVIPQRSTQSAALDRLSLVENRFRNVKGGERGDQTDPRSPLQSSSDLSTTGSHFLKKQMASERQEQKFSWKTQLDVFVPGGNERKGTFSPDSDEQDMPRLLGDSFSLSEAIMRRSASPQPVNKLHRKSSNTSSVPSPTSDRHNRRNQALHGHVQSSPSPKPLSSSRPESRRVMFTDRSVSESDHSEIRSLDDLFPVAASPDSDDTMSESVASDDFKLHVMTLDDLAPVLSEVSEISHDKKAQTEDNIKKSSYKISTVDSPLAPQEISAAYESDFESEVPSEEPPSANEISELITDDDREVSLVSEAQYTSYKSQDDDVSLSESFRSSNRSLSESSSRSGSDATVTRGTSPERQDAAVQTQTDGLTYTWSSGMAAVGPSLGMTYVDPSPIASHTVSAEAIESVTSYSPAMCALNDMLRQQLALTRAFIESTRHHYSSVMESLGPANYKYTTLEDTKEFIRAHRPPKPSVEEALQEVLQDMRDYHYN